MNAMEKLAAEIERVTELRARYRSLDGMPNLNVKPIILMTTRSLELAKIANGSNDPVLVVAALKDLETFRD